MTATAKLPHEEKHDIAATLRLGTLTNRRVKYLYRTKGRKHLSGLLEPFGLVTFRGTL